MLGSSHRCDARSRLGPGRAALFSAVSVATPLLAHRTDPATVFVTWIVIALWCGAWNWSRACNRPRNHALVAIAIGCAQLATHVSFALSASLHGTSHVEHMHHLAQSGGSTNATGMLLVHLLAMLLGAIIVTAIDRRVARSVIALVRRARMAFVAWLARGQRIETSTQISLTPSGAIDARARATRIFARSRARRGPPALAHYLA